MTTSELPAAAPPETPDDRQNQGLRVLASGVDSLYASLRGQLRQAALQTLMETRAAADRDGTVIRFRGDDGHFLLRPHGWRGYPIWLSSPRFELFVGASEPFPPAYVALHSPYIHTLGVEEAIAEVRDCLAEAVCDGQATLVPSRIDLYADTQGWRPCVEDFDRFVCRGVRRRLYEQPRQMHAHGQALSGFVFGKGDVVARVYDKTLEMRTRSSTWQELIWAGHGPALSVHGRGV